MKVVFWGTPQFAVPSLERLLMHPDFEVVGVVTQPDRRRGRGNQLSPSPVKAIALEAKVPIWQPERVKKSPETLAELKALGADAFVVVAYGQILSKEILEMPRLGCVNSHGSLLPYYRGAAPIQWSIFHGETKTGITTMLMDEGMDTGAMLLTVETSIGLFDTTLDVAKRLSHLSGDILLATLQKLDQGAIAPIPQNDEKATYAPLIHKPDFALDWSRPAIALHDQVRAFSPNCVAQFRDRLIKVIETVPLCTARDQDLPTSYQKLLSSLKSSSQHGQVVTLAKNLGPVVQTSEGFLLLKTVQLSGKRQQSGHDFANGLRVTNADTFGNGGNIKK
ncbi:MAG: methionyl-tRNA formyltransferase [Cyanobacteria bacterium P01_F01_bin.42]